ncbi:MAG: flippase-like domain-containing protein [Chloroflexi bacterium]|nr:flippase-like domain-containing protein [Chloroflexota bacterium]
MNLRRLITFIASLAVTAVFLALALYSVDLPKLAHSIASADYRLVGLAALFTFGGYVLRTKRWQRFLAPTKSISVFRLFPVLVVGFALNNLLPGRPGEFARPFWLGQRESLSKTLGFATIIVERVADGLALIAFLLAALAAFSPLQIGLPSAAETIAAVATALFGVALAGLVFLLLREELALSLVQRVARFMPGGLAAKSERMLASFVTGLHSLRSVRDIAAIGLLSVAVWTAEGVSYVLVLAAFGALPVWGPHLAAAVFMMVLINLGIMIPAAPGGLGPFEAAAVFALGVFGVSNTSAASVALAAHAMQYVMITGLGLVFIWRAGMSIAASRGGEEA